MSSNNNPLGTSNLRFRLIIIYLVTLTIGLFSLTSQAFGQDTDKGSSKSFELAPTLPTTIRCEVNEEILTFSKLSANAEWRIFPSNIAVQTQSGVKGIKNGTALLCGKDDSRISLVPITVETLTPSDHTILVTLRLELSKSNMLRNQLLDADAKLMLARAARITFATKYTDIDIELKRAVSKCELSYAYLQETASVFRKSRSDFEAAYAIYEFALAKLPDYSNSIEKLGIAKGKQGLSETTFRVILPAGFRVGAFVTPRFSLNIDTQEDWKSILRFEILNKPLLQTEFDKLAIALDDYKTVRINLESSIANYIDDIIALCALLSEQDSLPSRVAQVQREYDTARKRKLKALYELKENERRVEELQLFYRCRKWIESRTVVGFATTTTIFGIETNPFKRRIEDYRSNLESSLTTIDSITNDTSEPSIPDECTLPKQNIFDPLISSIAYSDHPTATEDVLTKESLTSSLLNYVELHSAAECLLSSEKIDKVIAFDRSNPNMEFPIPAGSFISVGVCSSPITTPELNALQRFRSDNREDLSAVGASDKGLQQTRKDRHIPSLHTLNTDVSTARSFAFTRYRAEIDKYNDLRASFDESNAASVYRKAAEKSLDTTNSIDSYLDWRISYIRIVHGGDTTRMIEFEKLKNKQTKMHTYVYYNQQNKIASVHQLLEVIGLEEFSSNYEAISQDITIFYDL